MERTSHSSICYTAFCRVILPFDTDISNEAGKMHHSKSFYQGLDDFTIRVDTRATCIHLPIVGEIATLCVAAVIPFSNVWIVSCYTV
mmetsp:Transcript_27590/g.57618  ORF Transcript_27590/g.57618 Transcript_27590/m.57618 type:complete len:87 (+) Transcript_27590:346-606(+)